MTTKLTLTLNDAVIKKAKDYAKEKNTSVSRIVEEYLDFVAEKEAPYNPGREFHSTIVDSMVGIFPDNGKDYKEMRDERRTEYFRRKGFL
jgi:hypothetical protein